MKRFLLFTAVAGTLASASFAHDGRRLEITTLDNQLVAQGYLSGPNPSDDGGGVVRPYVNAIHGHWTNNPSPAVQAASSTLPGFDVFAGSAFAGFDIGLELIGASKWVSPPITGDMGMIPEGTVPVLSPLGAGEEVFVGYGGGFIDTTNLGSFDLVSSASASGVFDIDLSYDIGARPSGELFVLDFVLTTDAPGIAPSETVHIILSPDGVGGVERLHFASLYLEQFLGTPVPAPGGVSVCMGAIVWCARRKRIA